jgi:hypothetical protein
MGIALRRANVRVILQINSRFLLKKDLKNTHSMSNSPELKTGNGGTRRDCNSRLPNQKPEVQPAQAKIVNDLRNLTCTDCSATPDYQRYYACTQQHY